MTKDELIADYNRAKVFAVKERAKLEELRAVFSKQCRVTEAAETESNACRARVTEWLLREAGVNDDH